MIKPLVSKLTCCLGMFGIVAVLFSIIAAPLLGTSWTADDPNILAFVVAAFFIPGPTIYFLLNQSRYGLLAWIGWVLLLTAYFGHVYFNAELHGPAIAFLISVGIWIASIGAFCFRKILSRTPVKMTGCGLAVGFGIWLLVVINIR